MIEIDIGFFFVVLLLSILGSATQFWQSRVSDLMQARFSNLEKIKMTISEGQRDLTALRSFLVATRRQRRRLIRDFIRSKRIELRLQYLDKWTIAMFFGFIAGILYVLISPEYLEVGYFLGAFLSGYAGESFVLKTLQETNPFEEFTLNDFEAYLKEQTV